MSPELVERRLVTDVVTSGSAGLGLLSGKEEEGLAGTERPKMSPMC